MFDPTPDLRAIQDEFGAAIMPQPPSAAGAFVGVFRVIDRNPFDAALVGDYSLRYLAADANLAPGDVLQIEGELYQVAETPARLNAHEMLAQLVHGEPADEDEGGEEEGEGEGDDAESGEDEF